MIQLLNGFFNVSSTTRFHFPQATHQTLQLIQVIHVNETEIVQIDIINVTKRQDNGLVL